MRIEIENAPAWLGEAPPASGLDDYGSPLPRQLNHAPDMLTISPSPFVWCDPALLPPREWLYGHHLCRKYVSATIAPGGVGKSTLIVTDALAMATGRELIGTRPHQPMRVWLWNGEDPAEEMRRRVIAAMLRHGIEPHEVDGRLFLDSGRDTPIRIGTTSSTGPRIVQPVIDALIVAIRDRGIDVLVVDPFVSVHAMPENDNGAMDAAVKAFALVADKTGCAIDLVHHSRKLNGADADLDAARGGSAIAGAVRAARALNVMSKEAADGFGIGELDRRSFVRIDDAKSNLAPASGARWFRLSGQSLGNGTPERSADFIAVVEPWTPPDAFDGIAIADLYAVQRAIHQKAFRESPQAANWVGHEIGRVLGLNSHADPDRRRIKHLIKTWVANRAFTIDVIHDVRAGREVKVVNAGEWASATP